MKNIKLIYVLSLVLLMVMVNTATAQTDVIWVHGYGETTNTQWASYSQLFLQERQMTTDNRFYTNTDGIVNMGNRVRVSITEGNANTILVGHSMGGVAAAEADEGVRGIITFGSPIDGAHIADAVANGAVGRETSYAIREMIAGPASQFFANFIVAIIVNQSISGGLMGRLIENMITNIITASHNNDSFRDLKTNSAYMNSKSFLTATPKISVWGNENSPAHYRLASSAKSNGANDTEIVNVVSQVTGVYQGFQTRNHIAGAAAIVGGFWNPWAWGVAALKFYRASQWRRGKDYLNGSEASYKWLVGAYRYETTTYRSYERIPCGGSTGEDWERIIPIDLGENCNQWHWVTRSYTRLIQEASDGFIAKSSQIGSNTASWNPTQVEARGVNHMEMGTHARTEEILRDSWNGLNGTAFIIPPR